MVYCGRLEMSTKVISSKIESDLYDELLQACNEKGCTISQFVKDACLETMGKESEFSESKIISDKKKEDENQKVYELERKIAQLKTDLSDANSTISKQNQTIKEYSEFVDPIAFHYWRLKRKNI